MIREPLEQVVHATFGGPQPGAFGVPGVRAEITADMISAAESRLGQPLPEALTDYYVVAGKYVGMMDAHSHFLVPADLHVEGGYLVFCHENQHVMEWGLRLDELGKPNPAVSVHMTDGPDAASWRVESATLTAFLLGFGSWQAVLSGEESAECELTEDELRALEVRIAQVGPPELRDGGPLVGYVDERNWLVAAYDRTHAMLYVGTSVEDGLTEFEERSGLELNWY